MKRSVASAIFSSSFLVSLLFLITISTASAQDEVCACTPSTYEFTFDFSLPCNLPRGDYPPGIAEVTCFITAFNVEEKDLTPVYVEAISIIEADTNRVPIAQSAINGNFSTGDSFTYTSVSALGNASQLPQSIQLTIQGINAGNATLVQVWAIKFTNDCNVYPVLEKGDEYGWTVLSDLGTPKNAFCPAAGGEDPPSLAPTAVLAPTSAPTLVETDPQPESGPTAAETDAPTVAPSTETIAPTLKSPEPTAANQPLITNKPSKEPTVQETDAPTQVPTIQETDAPTPEPTVQETDAPTKEPTIRPTAAPKTDAPSMAPTKRPTKGDKEDPPVVEAPSILPTKPPTIRPTRTPAPSPAPTVKLTKKPTDTPEELVPMPTDMSMSYSYDIVLGDSIDIEFGEGWEKAASGKKKKKDKVDKDDHSRVRIGTRRYYGR